MISDYDYRIRRGLPGLYWLLVVVAVVGFGATSLVGSREAVTFVLVVVLATPVAYIVGKMVSVHDARWFATVGMLGYIAKLTASGLRYWALEALYGGIGDATGYHNDAIRIAPLWESLQIPEIEPGTEFISVATGFIYAIYEPSKLGGFLIFATLAFVGQLLLYAGYRHVFADRSLGWYAALIFFFPNIVYWPSSIGKESLMILFIGIATYGIARLFTGYNLAWVGPIGLGLLGAGIIRSHIALLIAVSLIGALVLGKGPGDARSKGMRMVAIGASLVVLFGAIQLASIDFGIDFSVGINEQLLQEEIDPIFAGVEERTASGGSEVEGSMVTSPADVPDAVLRVVFRPLPYDAHNTQTLVNSIFEGTLLLALVIWRLRPIIRNLRRDWRHPIILYSLLYSGGFILGHSGVLNLGIIARQRAQLVPFILLLFVALGQPAWKRKKSESFEDAPAEPAMASSVP